MKEFSVLSSSEDLLELDNQFTLDELDDWQTIAGLTESALSMITYRIPGAIPYIFVHVSEAREYREINREGLATIPEDSLFIACLAMQNEKIELDELFDEYNLNDPFLHQLLRSTYRGEFILPIVRRFSLLAFILISFPGTPDTAQNHFLSELSVRLKTNLYAALIADERQRRLLRLTEYPKVLHKRRSVTDITRNLLEDLEKELPFDFGVYYKYDEYLMQLIPVVWKGTPGVPEKLRTGKGISGKSIERRQGLFVPDRSKHPSFGIMKEEPFIRGSFISAPICTNSKVIGVVTLSRLPENTRSFGVEHRYTLEIAAAFIATEISNRRDLEKSYFSTVSSLTKALEAKDNYTSGHSGRVMYIAVGIAQTLHLPIDEIRRIRYAAILHDIGKIGISDSIISKPSHLTDSEFLEIQRHTEIGFDIIKENDFFGEIRDLIRYHHEKMDGSGYNKRKMGDYPWESMIISIADIYDALISDRPYRSAFSPEDAMASLESLVNVNFDQRIFDAFKTWLTTRC